MTTEFQQKCEEYNNELRFIRLKEVVQKVGLSRSTIYIKMQANEFPQSVSLGANSRAWVESEIEDWMNERINNRNG